jgi:hypothetical protein
VRPWPTTPGDPRSKALHVETDLGDDDLRGARPDARDLVQTLEDGEPVRPDLFGLSVDTSLSRGDLPDEVLDAGGETLDLVAQGVDLVEEHPGELSMVGVEASGERLFERGGLLAHLAEGHVGENLGIALAERSMPRASPGRTCRRCRWPPSTA